MKIIILIIVFVTISCKTVNQAKEQDCPKITFDTDTTNVKFEGIITNIKCNCGCRIEIDNKWSITIIYGKRAPSSIPKERGKVTGIQFFPEDPKIIGKRVQVFAKIISKNKLTVEGSNDYYVKVIN